MGDTKVPFCLQSCVKPLKYAIAVHDHGTEYVHRFIGKEPSGLRFNKLFLNEDGEETIERGPSEARLLWRWEEMLDRGSAAQWPTCGSVERLHFPTGSSFLIPLLRIVRIDFFTLTCVGLFPCGLFNKHILLLRCGLRQLQRSSFYW